MHLPERWTLGRMQHPVRGFLHGSAAVVAAVGLGFLIARAPSVTGGIALAVFGAAMVTLFAVSALYHSVPWRARAKAIMQRVDHSAIIVFIAASYTPMAVIVLDGWLGWGTLAVVWAIAAVGVGQHTFFPRSHQTLSIVLHVTLGWLALLLVWPLVRRMGYVPLGFVLGGGILYTAGMVLMVTKRPRLWPRVFSAHEVFHVLVVAAAALHYVANLGWVAGYTA